MAKINCEHDDLEYIKTMSTMFKMIERDIREVTIKVYKCKECGVVIGK